MRNSSAVLLALAGICFTGCNDSTSPRLHAFTQVQQLLASDCGACHSHLGAHLSLNNVFQTTMDSSALVGSGFIDPNDPPRSLLLLKAHNILPHGGGRIDAFTRDDESALVEWIRRQPPVYGYRLVAARIDAASAPGIDGDASDAAWAAAKVMKVPISGGWADAREVTMSAVYDVEYVYFALKWKDDQASEKREPWVKQANGTWLVAHAKPTPFDGWAWPIAIDAEAPQYLYEDKAALMWNTYGTSTVAGFDQGGCAVTCHDPARDFGPGKTYFYSDQNRAAKKYTNAAAEIADIWHWKSVRMNQHFKIDDQYVGYWQPGTGNPSDGGRASDAGSGGYGSNPATNGRPTYRSSTNLTAPPFFILNSDKVALTDAELAALPVGAMIPNMITSGPSSTRAEVDARGEHDAATATWTLEIRRKLVTGDSKDVQFDDLAREYVFGVAVFDNAQIEHSYVSTPLRLIFQR
jgi:hypothetical protein